MTLSVYSSLEAVGLTAAVASALAKEGISANVIAAYHHDHVFVPLDKANQAMQILTRLSCF
ncbi:ACT domain-containing protein [Oligella ureolytica]|uniref:ACT domain-containing protein n=1 Tax=Oligella ureolytica TaxID=90244 RepID=UPI0021000B85|nr:ACT domain-containing protein [Oligella ureolytica]